MASATDPDALIRLACRDLENNDLAAAEANCLRALDADRDHSGAWTALGMVLHTRGRHDDSIRVFNSLTFKHPENAEHWLNLGIAFRGAKRYDAALAAFQRALDLAPPAAQTFYNIGLVHLERVDYQSAYTLLSQASEMAPTNAWIQSAFAGCCYDIGNFEAGLKCLEDWPKFESLTPANMAEIAYVLVNMGEPKRAEPAVDYLGTHPPEGGRAALTLVNVLERLNRLDAARSAMHRLKASLKADRVDPDVLLAEAVLAQRGDRHDDAQHLLSVALREHTDFISRHNLLFPLAESLDALGRYDEAFAALTEAHRSQVAYLKTALGKNPADESATIALTKHGTVRDDRARWSDQDAPPQADSPVFIVGFPRSGTTLLEQTLDAHPQLVSMDEQPFLRRAADRVNSFALQCPAELGHLSADQLRMIRAEYWQRVEKKIQLRAGQRLVDKNPFNLLRLPLIRRLFPNAQTVLIIRHPCDVLFSCFAQHFRAPDLAMLCRDLPTLAHGYRLSFDYWYEQAPLLQAATYEMQYEKFVVDFPAEIGRLTEFLGLPWDDSMLAPGDHARSKGYISTPSYSQVIEPVSSKPVGRWKNYERHFQGVLPELESYFRRWGYSI
jgi:tetratricopeptide (TPR) repeat protein